MHNARFGPLWSLVRERLVLKSRRTGSASAGQRALSPGSDHVDVSIRRYLTGPNCGGDGQPVCEALRKPTRLPVDLVIDPTLMTVVGVVLDLLGNPCEPRPRRATRTDALAL
jgi:hypothetical protein